MIVESPAKAKTIEKYLDNKFVVKSSFGHIRDLAKNGVTIDNENGTYTPKYVVPKDKAKLVKELKDVAKTSDSIWLATDEDREGEAISWHLCEVLGLNVHDVKRIVFHEITKSAIKKAVEEPRKLDLNLVNAQQARRVLDRLVGFELSPVLWKKVASATTLSAGRVQSVAVKLIVEREKEIKNYDAAYTYKTTALFTDEKGQTFNARLNHEFKTIEEVQSFLEATKTNTYKVEKVEIKPGKKSPSPPFTTSTLQQEASRKLGYSVSKTMMVAQKLYEAGHISYMRTDSVNLSDQAISTAIAQIKDRYGENYAEERRFKTKSAGAQEAHEAIRPTNFATTEVGDKDGERLYQLIWKRAIASQMAQAQVEKTNIHVKIDNNNTYHYLANGEVITFDGFLKVYSVSDDEDTNETKEGLLPKLEKGQSLSASELISTQKFKRPPVRYNEASLVRKMEELGIGRPSTYAPTISTIQKREYVKRDSKEANERIIKVLSIQNNSVQIKDQKERYGAEKNKLFPTEIGQLVTNFLNEHFENIMNYGFTAGIEKEFDEIASGNMKWHQMIDDFYVPFHNTVQEAHDVERVNYTRELGKDPESGNPVFARIGRYGPMIQIGEASEDGPKPKFAKLMPNQNIDTIEIKEALKLFDLPRIVGQFNNEDVKLSIGRYGPYALYKNKFYSLGKGANIFETTLEEAIEIIKAKDEANKPIMVFEKEEIQVLNGRYGPYIKCKGKNTPIPKGTDAKTLNLTKCLEIIDAYQAKKKKK